MLPIERQQQIMEWLKDEKTLRVSDLSERLEVSEMTIYRDLKPLMDEGKVEKTSGGIALASVPKQPASLACVYCYKSSASRHAVQVIRTDQTVEHACCAHCALLRYADMESEISHLLCKDFILDTTLSAQMATFLFNPSVHINCCQPQVLAFQSRQDALKFQTGFGGEVYGFKQAVSTIVQTMHHPSSSCCGKNGQNHS
ncbi:DeoR family transcriptional regulator [Marinicrinis sediminis]|uniref:DeoR family transcriptional regulator n=1 Tax=Marinicrinis sediminis TaxID=1652465 RepID=A0ABW5RF74_9BACL